MIFMTALATCCTRGTPTRMYASVFGCVSLSLPTRALLLVRWTSYYIRLYIKPGSPNDPVLALSAVYSMHWQDAANAG